jgi:hypothetical protein
MSISLSRKPSRLNLPIVDDNGSAMVIVVFAVLNGYISWNGPYQDDQSSTIKRNHKLRYYGCDEDNYLRLSLPTT